jgi:hypothetical protein
MTLPRAIIAFALLLWGCRFCCAQDLVLNWEIAYSGTNPGQTGWNLTDGGWPKFIERHVKPALKWADGLDVAILIHHPWGQWQSGDAMTIDAIDRSKADARFLTREFATLNGWKAITKEVDCYGYFGGADVDERVRKLPTAERCAMIARNLKPLADAGFKGVFIDATENAIAVPFVGVNARQSAQPSVDMLTLAIADDMFPERAGIEATPRAFPEFKHLWDRRCVLQESTYQHRYGPNRHANWQALGYDRSVLTGKVWRTLPYRDDVKETIAAARAISSEGDVPCVSPQPLVRAGVEASELVEGAN